MNFVLHIQVPTGQGPWPLRPQGQWRKEANLAAALNPTAIMNTQPEIVMLQPQTMQKILHILVTFLDVTLWYHVCHARELKFDMF